jgi:hypothetical protein
LTRPYCGKVIASSSLLLVVGKVVLLRTEKTKIKEAEIDKKARKAYRKGEKRWQLDTD